MLPDGPISAAASMDARGRVMLSVFVPDGVVTLMASGLSSVPHSIRYPGGKKVLNPWIRAG